MQIKKLIDNQSDRLTLIFSGWGMDSNPFSGLTHSGADLAVAWDYRTLDFDASSIFGAYKEINVVAWSFGVYAASRVLASYEDRIARRIAINGTCTPIDDRLGIPHAIFDGTLATMDERNLRKFYRRMCGSSTVFATFSEHMPQRPVSELTDELRTFASYAKEMPHAGFRWDFAIISDNDAIFPPDNQKAAWHAAGCEQVCISGPHIPDFADILGRYIVDKPRMAHRFALAAESYEREGGVQRHIATRLLEMAYPYMLDMTPDSIFEAGYGTGMLTRMYAGLFPHARIELYDLVPCSWTLPPNANAHTEDAESAMACAESASFDIVLSSSAMQWFSSPGAFMRNSWRALRTGGLLAISTFAPDNLNGLCAITGRSLAVPSTESLRLMASSAGFSILELSGESVSIGFDTPAELLNHLKLTGVTGLNHPSPRTAIRQIMESYPRESDGKLYLTYKPIYIILRKQ